MTDVQQGILPPPSDGDGAFEVDTSGIDFGGGPLTGGGRSQRERIIIAVGAVVAVLVVVFLGIKLFHKSGTPAVSTGSSTSTLATPGLGGIGTSGGTGASGSLGSTGGSSSSGNQSSAAAVPYQVYASRDPFVPVALPVLSSGASLFGATLSVTTTTVALPVTSTVTSPSSATTTAATGPPTTAPTTTQPNQNSGPPPSQTHTIELISVYTSNGQPTANLTVDGTTYAPEYEGSTFDSDFTVVTLDSTTSCGTFLYADYEFQLCSGQRATV